MTKDEQLNYFQAFLWYINHYFVWGGMRRCMDCRFHDNLHDEDKCGFAEMCNWRFPEAHTWRNKPYCPHFTPEWWEEQGYSRRWGDAAVNNFPHLEILRRETDEGCEFVVLAPDVTRRPVRIMTTDKQAGGGY